MEKRSEEPWNFKISMSSSQGWFQQEYGQTSQLGVFFGDIRGLSSIRWVAWLIGSIQVGGCAISTLGPVDY